MPIYTYTCSSCNTAIEKRQSFSDPPLSTCEQCGGSLRKVIHPVGIVFKGSGWYITDSRTGSSAASSTSSAPNGPAAASGSGESKGGAETKASDSGSSSGDGSPKSGSSPASASPSTTSSPAKE